MITVRYFAAAAEAAGLDTETFATEALPLGTAGDLRHAMVAAHGPELGRVLARCSLLAAGRRLPDDDAPVPDGVTVDVLPPFAGG